MDLGKGYSMMGMTNALRATFGLLLFLCLTACEKQRSDATVLEKEHIAAALPVAEASSSPNSSLEIGKDEIAVDSYMMKPEDRGTGRDPRALKDEQWLVKVKLADNGRMVNVPSNAEQFNRLNAGDRVRIKYQIGKYTQTIWAAEIVERKKKDKK